MGELARLGTGRTRHRVGEDGDSEVLAREPHEEAAETVESAGVGNLLCAAHMGAGPAVTVAVAGIVVLVILCLHGCPGGFQAGLLQDFAAEDALIPTV